MKRTPIQRLPGTIERVTDGKRISEMTPDEYLRLARQSVREMSARAAVVER
jgi:hypothetical protein